MNRICILSCILASILLSACSGGESSVTDAVGGESNAPETTAEEKLPFLPDGIDYGGEEYSILHAQQVSTGPEHNEVTYKLSDIETGDIIAEAIYERTRKAEEKLNIKIVSDQIAWDTLGETLSKTVTAGDNAFEAVVGRLANLAEAVPNGYLYDLAAIETLNLKNTWWDQQVNRAMTVGGKQCIATGDLNFYDDYGITCMMFNKTKFAQRGIAEPYDLVREGKWTLDAYYEIINEAAEDLNGDGKYDEFDFYGYVGNLGLMTNLLCGFGEEFSVAEDNGLWKTNMSASLQDKAVRLAEMLLNNQSVIIVERKLGYDKGDLLFPNGQALMTTSLVGCIASFRLQMEEDFGVLPNPKYDEDQESYHNIISQHWASSVSVPVTCSDFDRVGYVLETLGYYSEGTIDAAVIEKNMMTKSTRDEDSAEMLELIFDTKVFDTSIIFNWGLYNVWMSITGQTSPKIASTLTRESKKVDKQIADYITQIQNLES